MEETSSDIVSLSCSEECMETLNDLSQYSWATDDDVVEINRPVLKRSNAVAFPSRSAQKVRNWCFTLNNPAMTGAAFLDLLKNLPHFRYCVFQLEIGESGTRHFQGYLQFTIVKLFTTVQKMVPGWHIEICKGTPQQNVDYCTKTDCRIEGPWTAGEMSTSGKRTDLAALAKRLDNGDTLADVARNDPTSFIKYASGLYKYCRIVQRPQLRADIHVKLYIGPTGVGKTHQAFCNYPDAFMKDQTKWWEGYHGQKTVIMDEFAGALSHVDLNYTLRILDKWPMIVENKGGSECFCATIIIITTNIHPYNWYNWNGREMQIDALARRFHEVRIMQGREDFEWITINDKDMIKHFFNDPEAFGYIKKVPEKH